MSRSSRKKADANDQSRITPPKDDTNAEVATQRKGGGIAKKSAEDGPRSKSKANGNSKSSATKGIHKTKKKADVEVDKIVAESSAVVSMTKESTQKRKKATLAKEESTTEENPGEKASCNIDDTAVGDESQSLERPTKRKASKEPVQCITERDLLPKLWTDEQAKKNGSYTFKIASWNVAGLRAVMKKDPDSLAKLVTKHNLDVLCLQETKLQEMHLDDPKLKIREHLLVEQGYDAYYSCSTTKKGYSGTAVFVKQHGVVKPKQKTMESFFSTQTTTEIGGKASIPVDEKVFSPEKVSFGLGKEKHDTEGRVICVEFPKFTMTNMYVPNSGQKLERLVYRTEEWDKDVIVFAKEKQEQRGLPVMWLGDLNVAHKSLEAYNFGAKHLDKQAGLTPQERASFQEQLDAGFVDAFRHLHPTAKGHYSYWSQRTGHREPNKGLRLDYFICDPSFFSEESKVIARDSYMIPQQFGSDHCPIVLELEIKP